MCVVTEAIKSYKKTMQYPYKKFTEILLNLTEKQEYYKIFTNEKLVIFSLNNVDKKTKYLQIKNCNRIIT